MQCVEDRLGVIAGRTFPYDHDPPAGCLQPLQSACIALHVPAKFFDPELAVARRDAEISAALMCMPEAAVDQNCGLVFADDKVWPTWQTRRMQAKSDAAAEESLA